MTEATKTSLCHKYTMGILIPSKKKKLRVKFSHTIVRNNYSKILQIKMNLYPFSHAHVKTVIWNERKVRKEYGWRYVGSIFKKRRRLLSCWLILRSHLQPYHPFQLLKACSYETTMGIKWRKRKEWRKLHCGLCDHPKAKNPINEPESNKYLPWKLLKIGFIRHYTIIACSHEDRS